jgi:hypothetical protein
MSKGNGWLAVNQDNVYLDIILIHSQSAVTFTPYCDSWLKQQSVGRHYPDSQPTSRYFYSLMWQLIETSPWVDIFNEFSY